MRIRQKIAALAIAVVVMVCSTTRYLADTPVDFSKIFDNHGLVRLIIDVETGAITYANQAAVDFYGYSKEQLLAMKIQEINTLDEEQVRQEWEAAYREERNFFIFQHRLSNGEIRNVEVHSYPVEEAGKATLYSVVIDITPKVMMQQSLDRSRKLSGYLALTALSTLGLSVAALYASKEKYKRLANRDALTGAYSRLYFAKWAGGAKAQIENEELLCSLVVIDIDKFKQINDRYGHLIGDEVLKRIVTVLVSSIRRDDFVVRYGGDELLVILHNCTEKVAQTTMARVETKLQNTGIFDFPIEISYGIQEVSNRSEIFNAIKAADQKMYEDKQSDR